MSAKGMLLGLGGLALGGSVATSGVAAVLFFDGR